LSQMADKMSKTFICINIGFNNKNKLKTLTIPQ
jgi:hypothetical protein